MDTNFGARPKIPRLVDLVKEREIGNPVARKLAARRQVTKDLINRLGLEKELEGHEGCVNCLQWSENGQVLASASDDLRIILWDPFTYKKLHSFNSGHTANIFTVKFMPKYSHTVVSGAGDDRVRAFNFHLGDTVYYCGCHTARVKRIATTENTPFMFWSGAEDGIVVQHDLRTLHVCDASRSNRQNVLVDLNRRIGRGAEVKCIAINPLRPELMAVGANDPYIRMYDRRMIKLAEKDPPPISPTENQNSLSESCRETRIGDRIDRMTIDNVQYFIAGNLYSSKRVLLGNIAATYVTFSPDGRELLANMGGNHIYLFDILQPRRNKHITHKLTPASTRYRQRVVGSAYGIDSEDEKDYKSLNVKVLPPHVESIKLKANKMFELGENVAAINLYNKALSICPTAAVLYGNRSAAYMKRHWDGDDYAALRDCQTTLILDPEHVKAQFRLARCLLQVNRPHEASQVIEDFQEKFPDYTSTASHRELKKDIADAIAALKKVEPAGLNSAYHCLSLKEKIWREQAMDYNLRFCGHCNTSTDIKEANFFGSDGQYIIAGSDDANIFIWDRHTTNIVKVLWGDSKIVNCIQPHPTSCFLATSGIDPVVRLWSPLPEDEKPNQRAVTNTDDLLKMNQIRMHSDPLAIMLHQFHSSNGSSVINDQVEPSDDGDPVVWRQTCRPS